MRYLAPLLLLTQLHALAEDKKQHAAAGAIIATTAYVGTALIFPESKPWQRFLLASVSATAAGWAKELRDRRGFGQYEARDAWYTAAGGVGMGGICLTFDWRF